jgi:hypothetical protein
MKSIIIFLSLFFLSFLSSCVFESDIPYESGSPMAKVSVLARSGAEEISYLLPVHVYVFTSGGQCAGYQMLNEADDLLSFTLPAGEYTLYALTGVSADRYTLPSFENASASSPVVLTNQSAGHAEIEIGRADITLENGEHQELTLTVARAVAQMAVSVSGLPENLTGVKMSFQPLETVLCLDGSFDEEQAKRVSFSLAKKEEGVWHLENPVFLFPSKKDVSNVTVGIVLTDSEGEQNYSYNAMFRIEANYKYKIDAVYKAGASEPNLSGIFTGTDWAEEVQHTFNFGEGAESENALAEYAPGDFYQNLYILNVEKTVTETILTVLTPKQWDLQKFEDAEKVITEYSTGGISDWTFFSEKEAELVNQLGNEDLEQLNSLLKENGYQELKNTYNYLYKDGQGVFRTFPLVGSFQTGTAQEGATRYYLRGIKKLKLEN